MVPISLSPDNLSLYKSRCNLHTQRHATLACKALLLLVLFVLCMTLCLSPAYLALSSQHLCCWHSTHPANTTHPDLLVPCCSVPCCWPFLPDLFANGCMLLTSCLWSSSMCHNFFPNLALTRPTSTSEALVRSISTASLQQGGHGMQQVTVNAGGEVHVQQNYVRNCLQCDGGHPAHR
jgi:hypothetical protein